MDSTTEIWLAVLTIMCAIIGSMATWILNRIHGDIKELKSSLMVLPGLDRRITKVEMQLEQCEWHRRSNNGFHEAGANG